MKSSSLWGKFVAIWKVFPHSSFSRHISTDFKCALLQNKFHSLILRWKLCGKKIIYQFSIGDDKNSPNWLPSNDLWKFIWEVLLSLFLRTVNIHQRWFFFCWCFLKEYTQTQYSRISLFKYGYMRVFQALSVGNICSSVRVTTAKKPDVSPSYCVTTQKAYMTFWQVWLSSDTEESSPAPSPRQSYHLLGLCIFSMRLLPSIIESL